MLCAALAEANLLAISLLYPKSSLKRPQSFGEHLSPGPVARRLQHDDAKADGASVAVSDDLNRVDKFSRHRVAAVKKSWMNTWTTTFAMDREISLGSAFKGPLVMLAKSAVLRVIFLRGIALASPVMIM